MTLGHHTFRVMHLPGHDPAHIALVDTEQPLFLGGDVLFPGGHGRTDLPGADQEVMNQSLRRLIAELPAETAVLPGHGPATTIGAASWWPTSAGPYPTTATTSPGSSSSSPSTRAICVCPRAKTLPASMLSTV